MGRTMSWQLVESVSKEPGLVWKQKMPHVIDDIKGLFFVGDSTISYGIGTDALLIVHYYVVLKFYHF